MKILQTRAASVSRQGLCTALLVASLTTAAVGASPPHNTADGGDPTPGPDNPQSRPHGSPNLTLPDLVPRPGASGRPGTSTPGDAPDGATGIPATALAAYKHAEDLAKDLYPGCHIPWQLIAGIGKVESEHASGYGLRSDGSTEKPIIGPALTGDKFALVKDTDGGRWDGDPVYDHAVGPMQFIPSTWESYGADGRGLGIKDPNNIFDAAAGTARYLCAGNKDLSNPADLDRAILSYNSSRDYVNAVEAWMRTYQSGEAVSLPDTGHGSGPTGTPPPPSVPPARKPERPSAPSAPSTPSRPSTPSKPSEPSQPSKPSEPSKPGGGGDQGGDHGGDKPTPPTPAKPVADHLERLGDDGTLTATAGETFDARAGVKVLDKNGKPVPGAEVRFEIIGDTGARFPEKARTATVTAGEDGVATAPKITAGDVTGKFTVRATVKDVAPADFSADVQARKADELALVGKKILTAAPMGSFAERIKVESLGKGKPVAGTVVTATVYGQDGKPAETTGPFFKDKTGSPVRTVTLAPTGKDGVAEVPELFTGGQPGSYVLRLTTEDGLQVTVALVVQAAK
ncbi:hypothetical protein LKL35_23970 [Streptomyces sp. ET3-23]|uniref:lytic transglycosylase domain-containing protein n=1 Tax=Streptomyces sp. ET3-23 TaxID=2885643 RepID=UPI001D1266F0|nr:hypothetical protein [Streptomyces sp. ET3-23]MCC2278456.1 hypothetical protein [Streptomyces sp. ET3-23]